MLTQYVTVLQGTLAPALLIMALNVMLTVGEGRDKPLSAYWRLAGLHYWIRGVPLCSPRCVHPRWLISVRSSITPRCGVV